MFGLFFHNLYFHFICFILISFHVQVALWQLFNKRTWWWWSHSYICNHKHISTGKLESLWWKMPAVVWTIRFVRVTQWNNFCCISSVVWAEMKKQTNHKVDISLDTDAVVYEAQCECGAGQGPTAHCKHVIVHCLICNLPRQNELCIQQNAWSVSKLCCGSLPLLAYFGHHRRIYSLVTTPWKQMSASVCTQRNAALGRHYCHILTICS